MPLYWNTKPDNGGWSFAAAHEYGLADPTFSLLVASIHLVFNVTKFALTPQPEFGSAFGHATNWLNDPSHGFPIFFHHCMLHTVQDLGCGMGVGVACAVGIATCCAIGAQADRSNVRRMISFFIFSFIIFCCLYRWRICKRNCTGASSSYEFIRTN